MKLVIDIPEADDCPYPLVGERWARAGAKITVRDERGRVAWRGTVDGYKKDGRTSQRLVNNASNA